MNSNPAKSADKKATSRTMKVFALSFGRVLTGMIGIVSAMVLARLLTKGQYATYQQTFLAFTFVSPLMILGLPQALYYFLPAERVRQRGLVLDTLLISLALGSLFTIFIFFGGASLLAWRFSNPALENTLLYLAPYPFFVLPMGLIGAVLVIREKITALTTYNVITQFAIGVAVIISVVVWQTGIASIIGKVAITVPVGAAAVFLTFHYLPNDKTRPSLDSMLTVLKYALPLGLSTLIGRIVLQLDKIIVSSMSTPEDFAVYANGAVEIPLIGVITGSITAVVLADMRKSVVDGKIQEAVNLFKLTAEKSSLILLPAMAFLMVSGDSFIQTVFSEKYAQSVDPFRIYLLMLPMRTVVFGSLMIALGKPRSILFRASISLILNVSLSILLVSLIGNIGAAIATVTVNLLWAFPFSTWVISKESKTPALSLLPLGHFGRCFLFLLIPSALALAVQQFVRDFEPVWQLASQGAIFWLVVAWWWNGKLFSFTKVLKKITFKN